MKESSRRIGLRFVAMYHKEPWWAEVWSAATAIAWSTMSYLDPQPLSAWPSMQVLLEIGNERTWNVLGASMGGAQLVFLVIDYRWLRWGAAILMCCFWGILTTGVIVATPWQPAIAVYAGWCGINLFSILRLLRHYG